MVGAYAKISFCKKVCQHISLSFFFSGYIFQPPRTFPTASQTQNIVANLRCLRCVTRVSKTSSICVTVVDPFLDNLWTPKWPEIDPTFVRTDDKDVVVAVGTVVAVVGVVLLLRRGRGRIRSRSRSRSRTRSMSKNRSRSRRKSRSRSSIGVGAGVLDPQESPSNHFGASHFFLLPSAPGLHLLGGRVPEAPARILMQSDPMVFGVSCRTTPPAR